jgi:hypothetical protein
VNEALEFVLWVLGVLLAIGGATVITIMVIAAIRVFQNSKEDKR